VFSSFKATGVYPFNPIATEHQSFDFWVSFTEAPRIPATDPAHRGHLGSTSSVRLGPPRDAQGA
jgi:hypothetical protein